MFVEFKVGPQRRYPVWENIVLVEAGSEDEAFANAERIGRAGEGDSGGSFRWDDRPARWVFAGVRKLTECADPHERPGAGVEVSYNELELDSRKAVEKLAAGAPVKVAYNDRFRSDPDDRDDCAVVAKRGKRKQA